jgi:hypothetical protein
MVMMKICVFFTIMSRRSKSDGSGDDGVGAAGAKGLARSATTTFWSHRNLYHVVGQFSVGERNDKAKRLPVRHRKVQTE